MARVGHGLRGGPRNPEVRTALFVNSYLVAGGEGVVAVDAPLLVSDARACRARLDALHKPLASVLVTHPDHYNGLTDGGSTPTTN